MARVKGKKTKRAPKKDFSAHKEVARLRAGKKPMHKLGTDSYLSGISDASLEVLEHFGAEAPALLNQYCCAVEDKLIDALKEIKRLQQIVDRNGYDKGRVATAPF